MSHLSVSLVCCCDRWVSMLSWVAKFRKFPTEGALGVLWRSESRGGRRRDIEWKSSTFTGKVLYVSLGCYNEPEDTRISRTINRDFVLGLKSVRHRRNNATCLKTGRVYVSDELGCSGKIVALGLVPQWPKLKEFRVYLGTITLERWKREILKKK